MDNDIAIRIEGLGKRYHLGQTVDLQRTFRETLMELPRSMSRNAVRSLRTIARRALDFGRSRKLPAAMNEAPSRESETPPDTLWALRDINLEVNRGEVVGIIGRNGAGKSTLLKILSRVTDPTVGQAEIHGRVASLLEVGTGFSPELTGRENIYLNGSILGMKKAEIDRQFDQIVAFAEVEKFLDTPVKRYSSGMYVRLAFAVAAHLEPEILIVDEVLAVGDAAFQRKCLGKMDTIAGGGRTLLFVSHNMAAIESLCPRTIVLQSGRVVFDGPTNEALAHYSSSLENPAGPLRDRPDRSGSGVVRAVELRFLSETGKNVSCIGMGDSFSVEITTVGTLNNAIVGILFGNMTRKQLVRAYTWEQTQTSIQLKGTTTLRCRFEQFPMMHGSYYVHIWIGRFRDVADYVENAGILIVEPRDVFHTGRTPDPAGGIAFCKASWEVVEGQDG